MNTIDSSMDPASKLNFVNAFPLFHQIIDKGCQDYLHRKMINNKFIHYCIHQASPKTPTPFIHHSMPTKYPYNHHPFPSQLISLHHTKLPAVMIEERLQALACTTLNPPATNFVISSFLCCNKLKA